MTGGGADLLPIAAPERIDRACIDAFGGSMFEMSLNMGDCHRTIRRVVDKRTGESIGLGFTDISWKRQKRNGAKGGTCERLWHVDTHAPHIDTLDEALEILAIVRQGEHPA